MDTCENGYTCYDSINKINYCTDNCQNSDYKYEFKHICYQECPYNISEKSKIKDFFCEAKCPLEFPFKIIETQNCVNYCTINERVEGKYKKIIN